MVQERPVLQAAQGQLVKGAAFTTLGGVIVLLSLFFGYIEVGHALQGSAEAWMAVSALICAGVLGVGMVRVGRGSDSRRTSSSERATER